MTVIICGEFNANVVEREHHRDISVFAHTQKHTSHMAHIPMFITDVTQAEYTPRKTIGRQLWDRCDTPLYNLVLTALIK